VSSADHIPSTTRPTPVGDRAAAGEHHGVHLVDRRGITAPAVVAVPLVLGLIGGAIDVATGEGLRVVFSVAFIIGCIIAAARVHREDLLAAVVTPPLVYAALALLGGLVGASGFGGSVFNREFYQLVDALVIRFPVLFIATASAAAIALVRWLGYRSREMRGSRSGGRAA